MAGSEFTEGTSEGFRKEADQKRSTLCPEAVEEKENAEKEIMDNAERCVTCSEMICFCKML